MNEDAFKVTPIKVMRGPYSSSAYLYNYISVNADDVIGSSADNFTIEHISAIINFNFMLKKEEIEELKLENWIFGKFIHIWSKLDSGEIFDSNSYSLTVDENNYASLMQIAEKLCAKSSQKTVLVKDLNAHEMFILQLKQ